MLVKMSKIIEITNKIRFKHILEVFFWERIGFNMAIFVASLAFVSGPEFIDPTKVGILIKSFISALTGYVIFRSGTIMTFATKGKIKTGS